MRRSTYPLLFCCVVFLCASCVPPPKKEKPKPEPIVGETTQEIGEFDPADGEEVSDGEIKINMITGAAGAYGGMVEKVSNIQIVQAVNLFKAMEGRYPKDHEEFMSEVIKKNNIRLAMLPHGSEYKYDVENHALVVVKVKKAEANQE